MIYIILGVAVVVILFGTWWHKRYKAEQALIQAHRDALDAQAREFYQHQSQNTENN